MDGRGTAEVGTGLQEVVHIIAVKTCERCHIRAVAFALLEFVELEELGIRVLEVFLFDELIIVEVREENCIDGVVQDESEAALGTEVTELLMEHGLGERILELVKIDVSVAALPGIENLHVGPVVLREHASIFFLEGAKFRRKIVPGDQMRIETTLLQRSRNMGRARGVVTVDGQVATEASLAFLLVPRK